MKLTGLNSMSNNGDSNFFFLIINKKGKVWLFRACPWKSEKNVQPLFSKEEIEEPFAANDVGKNHEADEVNVNWPPRFSEYEEQEDDDDKGAWEAFIILGGPQNFELK